MAEGLDQKRARRKGHRGVVTKYIQEIKAFPEMPGDATRRWAEVFCRLLRAKQELLSSLAEKILKLKK